MTRLFRVIEDTPPIVSTILPDLEMLPEVHASKPSWLMRQSRTPSPVAKDIPKFRPPTREPYIESKSDKVLAQHYCISKIIIIILVGYIINSISGQMKKNIFCKDHVAVVLMCCALH